MNADLKRSRADAQPSGARIPDAVKSVAAIGGGAALLICLAVGAMMALTSPDGWVMKAASYAFATAQQGTLASYEIALD